MGGMSNILGEILVSTRMALAASFNEARVRDKGFRIIPLQDVMKTVAVCAASNQTWVAEALDLPVVALLVGFRCYQEDLVPFHHLPVAMTLLADLRMKLLPELNHLGFVPLEKGNLMKTMAIAAIRRIGISCQCRLSVNAVYVAVVGMAGGALFNDPGLILFPGRYFMNVLVTILALDVVDEMGARIMLGPFLLVATVARDWLCMNPGPIGLDVGIEVKNVPVATIARIRPVDRLSELLLVDLISVASQALGIVDALDTIFPVFYRRFLILLGRIGSFFDRVRFGGFLVGRRFGPPEWLETQKRRNKKDEKYQDEVLQSRFHGPPDAKKPFPLQRSSAEACNGIKD